MSRSARTGSTPRHGVFGKARRISTSLATVGVIALVAAACGSNGDGDGGSAATGGAATNKSAEVQKPRTIGIMMPNLKLQFFIDQAKLFRQIVEGAGHKAIVGVYDDNPVREVQIAEDWINAGKVDAITGSIFTEGFQSALDLAAEKKVPVVWVGIGVPEKGMQAAQTMILEDFLHWGTIAGEAIAKCINERLGGKAEVAILGGPELPGGVVRDRINGVKDGIAQGAPGAKIVAEQNGDNQQIKSYQVMERILEAHPNVNVVNAVGDDGVLAGMKALVDAGKDPKKLCIVGMDTTSAGLAALERGDFYAMVDVQNQRKATVSIEAALALVKDPNSPEYSKKVIDFNEQTIRYR